MPEIFLNYRTGDGENTAAYLDEKLSERFGPGTVYRATKSIEFGQRFDDSLIKNVRRCQILLAIIGPGWLDAMNRRGERALDATDDWVRKEIIEALTYGLVVVPVLDGTKLPRLQRQDLPEDLADLADLQSAQIGSKDHNGDITKLGDFIARKLPHLADAYAKEPLGPGNGNSIGVVNGNSGTVINGTHTGSGSIYGGHHFSGPGTNYIENGRGTQINQAFGAPKDTENEP
ncbi:TIR domain-containing protein [Streptosporangium canum]|uniref:TIR domain-containing protein n=1 Tax=Streptosporangium canum TaxID=324952 RepID=A0A1I4F824_9ACTN|nr:toll/interleukin-1 receptor domain-containing protein [Streptosporangium canum]SFL13603.1 TIR domain-containing protein [Streptosporangium canum]